MSGTLASADPDVRLDDARILAAGLLERLAREQRALALSTQAGTLFDLSIALKTTRGETERAVDALATELLGQDADPGPDYRLADEMHEALSGTASCPSDTLDAWAKALRSAT